VRGAPKRSTGPGRRRVVFRTWSALSGPIRVVDQGDLRNLVVAGETLSSISRSGDWSRLAREYWGRALDLAALPRRPAALFVGMGGGTQPLLLSARARPRSVTLVERDPVILRIAKRYFGVTSLQGAEFLCGDIEHVLPWLESTGRRFDFIMEDAIYGDAMDRALPIVLRLAGILSARGVLVVNRHSRIHAAEIAAALRRRFARVTVRRVRTEAENVLICATGKRRA
jgi:spermidine synthase